MPTSTVKYIRKGKVIKDITAGWAKVKTTKYESVSKAKKASRELQMSTDGGLGRGCLILE